jgi:uncharacterized protein YjbI with pentapeptide repeats
MKKIKEKWNNPEYLQSITKCVSSIVAGRPNIHDIDLSGIIIGPFAILSALKSVNLFGSNINNTNLSFSKISGSINNSLLSNVNFESSHLDRALLCNTQIKNCNFSKSKLIVNMDDAVCETSCFIKAKFGAGSSGVEYGGRRVKFINCDFTDAVFDRVEFRASKFINCIFTNAIFKKCDFRGIIFEGGVLPLASQFEKMDTPAQFI